MASRQISDEAIERRRYWVSEIVKISGTFGEDSSRVERELQDEISSGGVPALLDHLRLCGAIPESYGHDTSEEKLYSKYTDILLAVAFRTIDMRALVLTERADTADVEAAAADYSFVADAKAFRLSRTAKNQKDFKVQAMDNWKHGKPFALLVAPLYQLPGTRSQIYEQAIVRDVCILTYAHLALLVAFAEAVGTEEAQKTLGGVLQAVARLNPTKLAFPYWKAINDTMLEASGAMNALWRIERQATVEALQASKEEALRYLASERERIMRLSHDEALQQLVEVHKLESRAAQINRIGDTGLLRLV